MKHSRLAGLSLTSSLMLAGCAQQTTQTNDPSASASSDLQAQGVSQGAAHRHYRPVDCAFDNGQKGRCHAQVVTGAGGTPLAAAAPAGYSPAHARRPWAPPAAAPRPATTRAAAPTPTTPMSPAAPTAPAAWSALPRPGTT